MQRPLLSARLLSATAAVAVVAVSTAVAVLWPTFRAPSLSPLPGAAVAASSENSIRAAEGPKQVAPEAPGTTSETPSNRWGASYFPNVPVIDQNGRMNFPTRHPLNQTERSRALVGAADVILGLELTDFWGTVHSYRDQLVRTSQSITKPGAKLISITAGDLFLRSNYQDFERYPEVDLAIAADAEATLPSLIEAVKRLITPDRRRALDDRGAKLAAGSRDSLERARTEATYAWDASPISTARLVMETFAQIKGLDWSLVASSGNVSNWPNRLWPMEKHYHWLGASGGYGVGYGAPASVGAALANRDLGRFSVSIQSDGDLMYAPGVLWTAAKHKIPLLAVMHNNRGYHQEVMHVQRLSNFRNRVASLGGDMGPIGTSIENPDIEYHKLAESMGWWAKGPIKDPAQLGAAIKEAVAVVKSGQPALVNVWTQPR